MKKKINKQLCICMLVALMLLTTGCSSQKDAIQIGSKDFTESYILAELYALTLEDAGYQVERKFNLGGTNVTHAAIKKGELDVYPEYTGTCLINVLNMDPITDPDEVYDTVKNEYEKQFSLTLLQPAKASNSQGLAISAAISEAYHMTTISDLQANAQNVRFASQGAFEENPDGMPALQETYGEFTFKSVEYYDNAIKYELIKNEQADLIIAFTTDGQLTDDQFVLLEDDKSAWPPYNIVPVIRMDLIERYPDAKGALNRISEALDNEMMQTLNAKVDIEKQEPDAVAKEFFNTLNVEGD